MNLYCTNCHLPLSEDDMGHIVARKRVCDKCYAQLSQSPEIEKERAKQADLEKERLFSFLMSIFPIGEIPESWYVSVEGMRKKGINPNDVFNTLLYLRTQTEKTVTEENWTALIYVYYAEAMHYVQELRERNKQNQQMELHKTVKYYTPRDTTQRDTPNYNMEDIT